MPLQYWTQQVGDAHTTFPAMGTSTTPHEFLGLSPSDAITATLASAIPPTDYQALYSVEQIYGGCSGFPGHSNIHERAFDHSGNSHHRPHSFHGYPDHTPTDWSPAHMVGVNGGPIHNFAHTTSSMSGRPVPHLRIPSATQPPRMHRAHTVHGQSEIYNPQTSQDQGMTRPIPNSENSHVHHSAPFMHSTASSPTFPSNLPSDQYPHDMNKVYEELRTQHLQQHVQVGPQTKKVPGLRRRGHKAKRACRDCRYIAFLPAPAANDADHPL